MSLSLFSTISGRGNAPLRDSRPPRVHVVDGEGGEALDLTGVQLHGDHAVSPRHLQQGFRSNKTQFKCSELHRVIFQSITFQWFSMVFNGFQLPFPHSSV